MSATNGAGANLDILRLGVVVHPTRDVDKPMGKIRHWAETRDVEIGQIAFGDTGRKVADEVDPDDQDLIVAIGGDGTTLHAIRSGAHRERPVLGVACGSLGALAIVPADHIGEALNRFAKGDWVRKGIPALSIKIDGVDHAQAFNDLVLVRHGEGQLRVSAQVDGTLFARFAGDGCIASTPIGSSAYTIAAGGPLLPVGLHAFALTPLPAHGGFRPPLVVHGDSELALEVISGFGGSRIEVDGQARALKARTISIRFQQHAATVVSFPDQHPFLTQLRNRGVISDSPRIIAEDERDAAAEREHVLEIEGERSAKS
jgi:NAD+ kinase